MSASASAAPALPARSRKQKPDDQESRVASRGRRYPFEQLIGRQVNPDPVLRKFSGFRRIGLYSLMLQEFGVVSGWCLQWVNGVLDTERVIKAAKAPTDELQKLADDAQQRATKAWGRVRNQKIVLQKLLMGRFYGFSRAEKVWRFDKVLHEWIQDLYDVPWEAWLFADRQNDFLITSTAPLGMPVDASRFLHFQWGSADTKYGQGDLSEIYVILDKIQRIEECGLQAVEDWSRLVAIVHMPRAYTKKDRADAITGVKEQYRWYIVVPSDEQLLKVETPNMNVTANGGAGRQEYEVIRFYERWIQIRLLGAPQTQDKALGTGKVEETRKSVWEASTPIGSSALDQCLTEGWLDPYCDMNIADLAPELRPRFESEATEIVDGRQATVVLNVGVALVAKTITTKFAEETLCAVGIPRPRAVAMVESVAQEIDSLTPPAPPATPPAEPPAADPIQEAA